MRPSPTAICTAMLLSFSLLPTSLRAQQGALNTEVQITKIESGFVDSPKFTIPGYSKRSTGRPGSWLEIEVTFERNVVAKEPKYADELTFNYYVLLKNERVTEDKKPTLLTGSIVHVRVPQERGLHSVAFVSPRALASFFEGKPPTTAQQAVTDIGVTISGKGGLLAISTAKGTVKGDKGWWDNPASFTTVPGLLLNKNETPFAPLEWDFYEAIKPKSGN
ncbi:MAG: Amuc_1102 family pilus-like protein [Verrucomicrobiota bacterium]